ncbi:hypothetical protein KAR48_18965 [bacterium]|nr:hypothetical protein [bacterium]
MDILSFLVVVMIIVIAFKLLGIFFKAAFFLISIPLQILAAVIVAVVLFTLLPIAGLLALILIPLGLLAPLLPIILIGIGVYMLAKK